MKKNILFIACILLLSCNHQQSPQQTDNTVPSLKTSWSVKGCAEKATRSNTKFPDSGEYNNYPDLPPPGDLGIKSAGDSIVYSRFEQHLCCRQVKVEVEKKENIITVTEYWFGRGCKCRCSSTVHAVIRQLPKGEYTVLGVATGTDPVEDKPTGIKDTVLTQKVIIK
jgi:hypothetical protein